MRSTRKTSKDSDEGSVFQSFSGDSLNNTADTTLDDPLAGLNASEQARRILEGCDDSEVVEGQNSNGHQQTSAPFSIVTAGLAQANSRPPSAKKSHSPTRAVGFVLNTGTNLGLSPLTLLSGRLPGLSSLSSSLQKRNGETSFKEQDNLLNWSRVQQVAESPNFTESTLENREKQQELLNSFLQPHQEPSPIGGRSVSSLGNERRETSEDASSVHLSQPNSPTQFIEVPSDNEGGFTDKCFLQQPPEEDFGALGQQPNNEAVSDDSGRREEDLSPRTHKRKRSSSHNAVSDLSKTPLPTSIKDRVVHQRSKPLPSSDDGMPLKTSNTIIQDRQLSLTCSQTISSTTLTRTGAAAGDIRSTRRTSSSHTIASDSSTTLLPTQKKELTGDDGVVHETRKFGQSEGEESDNDTRIFCLDIGNNTTRQSPSSLPCSQTVGSSTTLTKTSSSHDTAFDLSKAPPRSTGKPTGNNGRDGYESFGSRLSGSESLSDDDTSHSPLKRASNTTQQHQPSLTWSQAIGSTLGGAAAGYIGSTTFVGGAVTISGVSPFLFVMACTVGSAALVLLLAYCFSRSRCCACFFSSPNMSSDGGSSERMSVETRRPSIASVM